MAVSPLTDTEWPKKSDSAASEASFQFGDDLGKVLKDLDVSGIAFVGRDEVVVEVRRLLSENRLLTLAGAGGCAVTVYLPAPCADVNPGYS